MRSIRCRMGSSPSNNPSCTLSIRPPRSTYTSSGPLTMTSVTSGILQQELDRTEPDDFVGNLVHHAGELALRQDRAALAQQPQRLLAHLHPTLGATVRWPGRVRLPVARSCSCSCRRTRASVSGVHVRYPPSLLRAPSRSLRSSFTATTHVQRGSCEGESRGAHPYIGRRRGCERYAVRLRGIPVRPFPVLAADFRSRMRGCPGPPLGGFRSSRADVAVTATTRLTPMDRQRRSVRPRRDRRRAGRREGRRAGRLFRQARGDRRAGAGARRRGGAHRHPAVEDAPRDRALPLRLPPARSLRRHGRGRASPRGREADRAQGCGAPARGRADRAQPGGARDRADPRRRALRRPQHHRGRERRWGTPASRPTSS